jgi:chorismate mutase/prephenate dehydratase
MAPKTPQELIKELAEIDAKLLKLINQRALITRVLNPPGEAAEYGAFGALSPQEGRAAIKQRNRGPVGDKLLDTVFTEIASACREYRPNQKIAYLGEDASFTKQAANKHFGKSQEYLPCSSINDVFSAVERRQAVLGIAPVESSLEGAVSATLNQLIDSSLKIIGEIYLPISYSLLSSQDDISGIEKVLATRAALEQCRDWITRNLPQAAREEAVTTRAALKQVKGSSGLAVIAGHAAAKSHGLKELAQGVEDEDHTVNRYLILGSGELPESGNDKTSVLFATQDHPGALLKALHCFADHGVNLNRIESRPARKQHWKYYFFADLDGHHMDQEVDEALGCLKEQTAFFRLLGSYPKADPKA